MGVLATNANEYQRWRREIRYNNPDSSSSMKRLVIIGTLLLALLPLASSCSSSRITVEKGKLSASIGNGVEGWIYPAKSKVTGLETGKELQSTIRIFNGSIDRNTFNISVRCPDYTEAEYVRDDGASGALVVLSTDSVDIEGKSEGSVVVTFKKLDIIKENVEFWISIKGETSTGLGMELCSRWLVPKS